MKLLNGDCYELIKQIPDKSIDLIITDPPYQFCQGGNGKSELGQRKSKNKDEIYNLDTDLTLRKVGTGYSCGGGCFGTKNRNYHSEINDTDVTLAQQRYKEYVAKYGKDEQSERLRIQYNQERNRVNTNFILKGFTNDILDECCRIMKKINIYIWCNKEQLVQILTYFHDKGCFLDLLTWHKTNPIPTCNGTYLSDTEYCIFAREKGVKIYGSYQTKRKYYVTPCNVEDKKLYGHPTIKPLNIIENLVINSSVEGGVLFDPFMGSGTLGVACKHLNRDFIGIELNPTYYEIAVKRIDYQENKIENIKQNILDLI